MWCAYSKPIKRFVLAFWLCTSWIAEALYCTVRFGFWSHVRPWCRRRCSRCVCGIPSLCLWNKLHWCVMITHKCTIYIHTWHISTVKSPHFSNQNSWNHSLTRLLTTWGSRHISHHQKVMKSVGHVWILCLMFMVYSMPTFPVYQRISNHGCFSMAKPRRWSNSSACN